MAREKNLGEPQYAQVTVLEAVPPNVNPGAPPHNQIPEGYTAKATYVALIVPILPEAAPKK